MEYFIRQGDMVYGGLTITSYILMKIVKSGRPTPLQEPLLKVYMVALSHIFLKKMS
jgi:hypothetical protein